MATWIVAVALAMAAEIDEKADVNEKGRIQSTDLDPRLLSETVVDEFMAKRSPVRTVSTIGRALVHRSTFTLADPFCIHDFLTQFSKNARVKKVEPILRFVLGRGRVIFEDKILVLFTYDSADGKDLLLIGDCKLRGRFQKPENVFD